MTELRWDSLHALPPNIKRPTYTRETVRSGIVHFGVGNFHRAHQAAYCDALLNRGETDWGITGVSMRSPAVRDRLEPQDYLYTQLILGEKSEYRILGAIRKIIVASEAPGAVTEAVASSETALVTCTITEKGYCLESGELNRNHPDFAQDLRSLARPLTIYGFIAAALIARANLSGAPLTVLCCDNLNAGGDKLWIGVERVLQAHSNATLEWTREHVAFCSSMVDRVTPATSDELITRVSSELGYSDRAPVATEPFTQWVIEDRFIGRKPPFNEVGALFVPDIAPYERAKLRLLNAGHSILATLGYLAGDTFIHEALARPNFAEYTQQTLEQEILPVTLLPSTINGTAAIGAALARFRNIHLPYAVLQVSSDSSQKILQRWIPAINDALEQGKSTNRLEFALAAWIAALRKAAKKDEIVDPLREQISSYAHQQEESITRVYLSLAGAQTSRCFHCDELVLAADSHFKNIENLGIERALMINATKNI